MLDIVISEQATRERGSRASARETRVPHGASPRAEGGISKGWKEPHHIYQPLFLSGPLREVNPRVNMPETESIGGVRIHRMSAIRFGRAALIGRGFDCLSFYSAAGRSVLAFAKPGDALWQRPTRHCCASRRCEQPSAKDHISSTGYRTSTRNWPHS